MVVVVVEEIDVLMVVEEDLFPDIHLLLLLLHVSEKYE
jgi:hypothetical protein